MKLNFRKLTVMLSALFLFVQIGFAQELTISGKVTDKATGESLPGVSILLKGTTRGTVTDLDGKYTIKGQKGQTLTFSFMGYLSQPVTIGSQTVIDIKLVSETKKIEEVMVVGYGIQKKREITGSIAKVESNQIANKITPSFESALAGQAAGVNVTTGSGMAGSGSVIRIRGISSISSGGDPLYVVDGIPITNDIFGLGGRTGGMNVNPLASINANDIESIEVLKDASAAGIYGSRGANGVVIVTTKHGKSKQLTVDFSTRQSISNPDKKVNMCNAQEWLQLYQEAWENDGNTGIPTGLPGGLTWAQAQKNNTDWWNEITRTGYKQDYNLSANYAGKKFKVYAGATYDNDQSYMIGNVMKRMSGKLNLDYAFSPNYTLQLSTTLTGTKTDLPGNPWDGGLGAAMGYALPIYPIYNADGTFFKGGGNAGNPIMMNKLQTQNNKDTRTINSLAFMAKPIKNLTLTLNSAVDYYDFSNNGNQNGYTRTGLWYQWNNYKYVLNYNYFALASYDFTLQNGHSLTAMIGHEYQRSKTTGTSYTLEQAVKAGDPSTATTSIVAAERWAFISFFTRINYKYKDRYIVQGSLRADGSSRFGKNKKYGYFPTIALGWIVSEESFLKGNNILSFLKLKTSYGITGNSNIPNYEAIGTYTIPTASSYYNGLPIRYQTKYSNPELQWEPTQSFDAGFEAGFFDGRINTEAAFFYKYTTKVFINQAVSATTGFGNQWQNLATIRNRGVEFNINTRNFVGDFTWNTNFNIASLQNKVLSVGGLTGEVGGGTNDTRILVGYPVGTNMLVRVSRIDPADGRPIYLDKNGNETKVYKFEGDDGYKVPIGKVIPDFTGGCTNTFAYKGFELSALLTFSYGSKIYDSSAKRQMGLATDWNFRTDRFDRWRKPGDIAKYPRMSLNGSSLGKDGEVWFNSDMWLYNGSYVRMKNLTFSYNIPTNILKPAHIKAAKVSLSGTNLFTFTKYPGADPEVARDFDNATDRNMSVNVNFLNPPQERTYSLSLNLTF
ncbi:MAG: TonB-dependent receptor [Bacteroidota bacterium]|nr:TonB-dependent receptor [Bacteroidota bacterium]